MPKAYSGDLLPPIDAQGTPTRGGTLAVAMGAEPPSLNYQLDPLDAWGKKINELVMESLARPNVSTWEHEPHLAESWDITPDHRTLTFFLRKNVHWHDGHPFTADDVVFTFDKLRDPKSETLAIRSYLEPISHYEKKDPYTVVFHLERPYVFAFDAIAEVFIYPRHVYAEGDFNTHPANRSPVGLGRFRFEHWKTGNEISLVRNDDYYGHKTALDRLVFRYVPDPTIRSRLLENGDVDVLEEISPEEWRSMTTRDEIAQRFWRLRHIPAGLQWIGWNQERPLFRDRRVRQALTMLLDRRDIVDNIRFGLDTVAASWFYPGSKEHDPTIEPWPYAPSRAARLLDEAGWSDHDGDGVRDKDGKPFRFTFVYPAGPPFYEQLAGLMRAEYRKAGIDVETARLEWAIYSERLRQHAFDACSLLWQITPRDDPFQVWHSSAAAGGSNFISFRHPEVDRIVEKARMEFDEARRIAQYRRFNRILHDEQPYTMLFYRYNLSLVSKRFAGIISTPYGVLSYGDFFCRAEGAP